MSDSDERPRLRGPLAPVRLFLSSGKAVGRAGKKYLEKVKRPGRASRLASVSAAQFPVAPEDAVQEHWWQQGLPHIRLPGWLQNRGGEASASSQQASQQQQQRVAGKTCFPAKLCLPDGAGGTRCSQDLLTVGSRQWGHPAISSLLRVKIYDFALYMDGEQARASGVRRAYADRLDGARPPAPRLADDARFYAALRSAEDVDMALVVRASRALPIRLLAGEYERILRRRLAAVGGSPDDAGLARMLTCFREEALPAGIKDGQCVRKGTVLEFRRDAEGNLAARADDVPLITVASRPLCAAIFDLYIGEQPVSKRAKQVAGASFARLVNSSADTYEPPREQLVCAVGNNNGAAACQL